MTSPTRLQCIQQSRVWNELLPNTPTRFTTAEYDQSLRDWSFVRVLIVGAGGIGCELLHQVAMCGFANITIIDMDKVELSNLNRQFLFREADIGQYKSEVAAKYIHDRFTGIHVQTIVGRIERQSDYFYRSFHVILLALDSVEARLWINNKIASLAIRSIITKRANETDNTSISNTDSSLNTSNANTNTTISTSSSTCASCPLINNSTESTKAHSPDMCVITHATFIIDTGTEGYQGHCRIIDMSCNYTPCIECERELFIPEHENVALCTLHHYPRRREDCVLYAAHVLFPTNYWTPHLKTEESVCTCEKRENSIPVEFDLYNVQHVNWVSEHARARQELFQVDLNQPIDVMYTRGVLEHIVPAVNFTNSFVAGEAVLELMKWLWGVGLLLNNFAMINGAAPYGGIHFHKESLKTDELECRLGVTSCAVCSPLPVMNVRLDMNINEVDELIDNIYNCHNKKSQCKENCSTQEARDRCVKSTLIFSCTYNMKDAQNANNVADSVQHKVFLSYREGHPLAKTICGNTLYDILVYEYHLLSFVQEWQHRWMLHKDKHNEMNVQNIASNSSDIDENDSTVKVIVATTNEVIIPVIERLAQDGKPSLRVAIRLVE